MGVHQTGGGSDPTVQAAVERRIERMLDATAARLVSGGARTRRAHDPEPVTRSFEAGDSATAAEPQSFAPAE